MRLGVTKEDHEAVAKILGDVSLIGINHPFGFVVISGQETPVFLGVEGLSQFGRTLEIAEQHGELSVLGFRIGGDSTLNRRSGTFPLGRIILDPDPLKPIVDPFRDLEGFTEFIDQVLKRIPLNIAFALQSAKGYALVILEVCPCPDNRIEETHRLTISVKKSPRRWYARGGSISRL